MNGMVLGKVAAVPAVPAVPLTVSEDTPPDQLAGCMDLRVVLPCGSVSRCSVDRSTPMMDLLVQLARAHKISPAAHTLQPFGINSTPLHCQPSTPIGALDVFTVKIVPKAKPLGPPGKRAAPRPAPAQPFEQTFRLQVHLPRNQLFVTRASRATVLGDIRHLACTEKNLDPNKYELRHPANLDQRLSPESTLGECGLTEVALVAGGGRPGSTGQPDIMALRRQEDKRREAAKAGQFGYLSSHTMAADGSVSSASSGSLGGRSTSPAPSDGERSTSPPSMQPLHVPAPPSRPGRKRRPAPKPPVVTPPTADMMNTEMNNNINKEVINSGGTVISHSRNSSDSSGYHEASVLSESPEGGVGNSDSLPGITRRSKMQSCVSQPNLSRSMSNLNMQQPQLAVRGNRNSIAVSEISQGQVGRGQSGQNLGRMPASHSASTSSLSTAGQRKKKAPPPPPPGQSRPTSNGTDQFLKTQSLERPVSIPETPDSQRLKSCTLPTCSTPSSAYPAVDSSSSCPTPTLSEQSAHLSENTPPKVAPRLLPRVAEQVLAHNVSLANAPPTPAPRPRPRKQIAPTPPASPSPLQDNLPPQSENIDCPSTESTPLDDVDNVSEASSWVFNGQMEDIDQVSMTCDSSSHKELETGLGELKLSTDNVEIQSEAPFPTVKEVVQDQVQPTLNINGEDGDSDFGTEELSPQASCLDSESLTDQGVGLSNTSVNKRQDSEEMPENLDPVVIGIKEKRSTQSMTLLNSDKDVPPLEVSSVSQVPIDDDWEYRLPSPPSAFRDSLSHSSTVTEIDGASAESNLGTSACTPRFEEDSGKSPLKHKDEVKSSESSCEVPVKSTIENQKNLPEASCKDEPSFTDLVLEGRANQDTEDKSKCQLSPASVKKASTEKTVINSARPVMNSSNVPLDAEKKMLLGTAAVLNEFNDILTEQRCKNAQTLPTVRHASQSSLSGHEPAPLENFSMTVYSRPSSVEEASVPEVRPSLVLARRSSFSNSNGNLNTLPRSQVAGVRRTTSHATLVGSRRDTCSSRESIQKSDFLGKSQEYSKTDNSEHRQDVKPLGRAVSEMNLNAELSMAPIEPELLKEFMEWRQQRQKELQERESQQKVAADSVSTDLQSPQVLRTILPHLSQSQDDINKRLDSDNPHVSLKSDSVFKENRPEEDKEKKTTQTKLQEPVKRVVPRGPPSIQLSTWNERPKRQVSIKMDRDYWIGVGGVNQRSSQTTKDKLDGPEPKVMATVPENQASQTAFPVPKEERSTPAPPSVTVQRLSKQYIVHTTPSGFRRPADPLPNENNSKATLPPTTEKPEIGKDSTFAESKIVKTPKIVGAVLAKQPVSTASFESENSNQSLPLQNSASVEVPVTPKNDPSRVPIVRAVELKKPIAATDVRKPLLRQNATTNSSVVYFSSGPIATSSVTANSKIINHSSSAKPATAVKKFTSVVDISGPSTEKALNGSAYEKPASSVGSSVSVNGFASHVEPKRNLPMPVVKGFKLAQGVVNRQLSAPAATPPPPDTPAPPPAPVMPVLKKVPRPTSLPARVQDPREQLLDAIRNFGGRTKLRPTT